MSNILSISKFSKSKLFRSKYKNWLENYNLIRIYINCIKILIITLYSLKVDFSCSLTLWKNWSSAFTFKWLAVFELVVSIYPIDSKLAWENDLWKEYIIKLEFKKDLFQNKLTDKVLLKTSNIFIFLMISVVVKLLNWKLACSVSIEPSLWESAS